MLGLAARASSTLRLARVWSISSRAHVDQLDLGALDGFLDALDALPGVVRAGQSDEPDALAAVRQPFQHQLAGFLAEIGVGRADVGDALRLGGVAVGGEEQGLGGDLVQPFRLVLRIDGADHDARGAGRDQILHDALLHRSGGLLGISELEVVVRQFSLRLLYPGFGDLPEVRSAVDDEDEGLLIGGGRRRDGERQDGCETCRQHMLSCHLLPFPARLAQVCARNKSSNPPGKSRSCFRARIPRPKPLRGIAVFALPPCILARR